jgi:hypothetical protein
VSRIDSEAAAVFFAEYLLPLRMANVRARLNYLDQEGGRASYWAPIATRTGGSARVDPARTDVAALLDSLGDYWRQQGETRLPKLLPELVELHRRLAEAATQRNETSEPVIDYMYPMF